MNRPPKTSEEPNDLEAERAVLGSVLLNPEVIGAVLEWTAPGEFYQPAHRFAFEAMVAMAREQRPIDLVTLGGYLRDRSDLEAVGGMPAIVGFSSSVATAANAGEYAKAVHEKFRLRETRQVARRILASTESSRDAEATVREAQQAILDLTPRTKGRIVPASVWAIQHRQLLDQRANSNAAPNLDCGIFAVDDPAFLRREELVLCAARPAMGKSAFCENVATGVAKRNNRVLMIQAEMSQQAHGDRITAAEATINTRTLEQPSVPRRLPDSPDPRPMTSDEWLRADRALRAVAELPFDLWVGTDLSIFDIRTTVMGQHRVTPYTLIVVDYLQLIQGDKESGREREVAMVAQGLKMLAKETGACVLALSALNRALEQRSDRRPMMSDIRESGSIEFTCDTITFLYRDSVYNDGADPEEAELIFGKYRFGQIGYARMRFQAAYQKFSDPT